MSRVFVVIGIFTAIAWALIATANADDSVPVQEAAAKLQEAWADNHTTA
jgi:hypothetical protein